MKTLTSTLALVLASLTIAGADTSYTVKTGDTVYSIAKRHQTSAKKIIEINKIDDPSNILIGQKLILPDAGAQNTSTPAVETASKTHQVAKGDTFYSIAKSNKMSVTELKALNPSVDVAHILIGQDLVVSGKAAPVVPAKKTAPALKKEVAKVSKPTSTKKTEPKIAVTQSKKVEKTAPKKETTVVSTPKKETVVASAPKKEETKESSVASSSNEKTEAAEASQPAVKYNSVIVSNETTLGDFAQKHRTSIELINSINGWNLGADTPMARGSEIYVPK